MTDCVGSEIQINDWVAFYKTATGKSIFGKVVDFNTNSVVVLPNGKSRTITKTSAQVFKVPTELVEGKKVVVKDAIGNELKPSDWVATTYSTGYIRGYGGTYNGKIILGKVEKLTRTSVHIRVRTRKTVIKKMPTQIIRLTDEQAMLQMFIQG